MNINFTPADDRYRLEVRTWLAANLPQTWKAGAMVPPLDKAAQQEFLKEWERRLYAAGYSGIAWPKEYGGQGLSMREHYIVSEEIGKAVAPDSINIIGRELVGPILLRVGSEDQKRQYIPRILNLDNLWCQGFSEPNAGSDLASLKTRARSEGSEWVIDGQKIWASYAHLATHCILLARTDSSSNAHRALTLFIVEMSRPGIEVRPIQHMNGKQNFNEVFFTGVRVPDSTRIGAVNEGWKIAVGLLGFERATARLYRQALYMTELKALYDRAQHPSYLLDDAEVQIGKLGAALSILRYHNLQLISRIGSGYEIGDEASVLKLLWSETHQELAGLATEIFQSDLDDETPEAERFREIYFTARGETIYAGSSQIQRNIIAERVLGLPRS